MSISIEILKEAIAIKEEIASLESRLVKILGTTDIGDRIEAETTGVGGRKKGRRKMSAAGRARIAEAQRARWAKRNKVSPAPEQSSKKKRKLSPEGRAKIVAALKKRWAAAR